MNLAIVIGISKYVNAEVLPACGQDAALVTRTLREIRSTLEDTKKFEKVLVIDSDLPSVRLKQKISSFVAEYSKSQIEELFFYFTGHGDFDGTEFYYLLGDYDPSQKNQTSLSNTELDDWLRSLNPNLALKMVDACHAGVQYIKEDPLAIEKYFSKPHEKGFKNCYFMYSSQTNQSSYQDSKLSSFTRSFLSSLVKYSGDIIRYKDIIDFISDEFSSNRSQKPFFVIQASNTEEFGRVSSELAEFLKSAIIVPPASSNSPPSPSVATSKPSLFDLVKADSKRYCTEKEFEARIKSISDLFSKYSFDKDLCTLYTFEKTLLKEYSEHFKRLSKIGTWLNQNGNPYFTTITWRDEKYEERDISSPFHLLSGSRAPMVTKYRKTISGFELTQNVPVRAFQVIANPKLENIATHGCFILYVFSKTNLRFFYAYGDFKDITWTTKSLSTAFEWQTTEVELMPEKAPGESMRQILFGFEQYINGQIKARFEQQPAE
jgi:hypothetical protein